MSGNQPWHPRRFSTKLAPMPADPTWEELSAPGVLEARIEAIRVEEAEWSRHALRILERAS